MVATDVDKSGNCFSDGEKHFCPDAVTRPMGPGLPCTVARTLLLPQHCLAHFLGALLAALKYAQTLRDAAARQTLACLDRRVKRKK